MGNVDWTDEAVRWLRRIHDHVAQNDAKAANRVVRAILSKAQALAHHRWHQHCQRRLTFRNYWAPR